MRRLVYVLRFSDTEYLEMFSGIALYLTGLTLVLSDFPGGSPLLLSCLHVVVGSRADNVARLVGSLMLIVGTLQLIAIYAYTPRSRVWMARLALPLWASTASVLLVVHQVSVPFILYAMIAALNAVIIIRRPSSRFYAISR